MKKIRKQRRIVSLLLILLILLVAGILLLKTNQEKRYEAQSIDSFDTLTKVVGYAKSEKEFKVAAEFVHERLMYYHKQYDIYNDYEKVNNVKTINQQAGKKPVKVDSAIIELLEFCKEVHQMTDGKVNVAMGSVLSIWHDYREKGIDDPQRAKLPPRDLLKEAEEHTDIDDVIIDKTTSTVFLADPEMRLDVGALAKGFAVEKVAQEIQREKYSESLLISVGGNVRSIGYKGKKSDPWRVGIETPNDPKEMLEIVDLIDAALVTSGDYQRYYTVEGKRYHHIIDPKTLMPSDFYRAVTVCCSDSGMADALSTAVFLMDFQEGKDLIHSVEGASALCVMRDGSLRHIKDEKGEGI